MKKTPYLILILGLIGFLTISLLFAGCKTEAAPAEEAVEEAASAEEAVEEAVTVGFTYQNLANEFDITMQVGAADKLAEIGKDKLNLLETDGLGKAEMQISQVENFITSGADIVMMQAFDKEGCQPAVDVALDAGIPMIIVNSIVGDMSQVDSFVGSIDKDSGIMLMEYLAESLDGKGKIVMLEGPMGHAAQIGRSEGILEVLEKYPDIELVAQQTGNWSREESLKVMENWLQSGMEIDGVAAQNDEMGLGAMVAIEAAGKLDDIQIIGIDAIPDAVQAVKDGKFICTVFQDAYGQAYKAVEVGYMRALGEDNTSPGGNICPNSEYIIPFQYVTPENAGDF